LEAKIKELSPIERELEIIIPETELQEAFEEAFREIRPKLALPGFRPGKAPMGLVKKMHGDAVEGDTLEKLAQEKFRLAAKEHDIKPLGYPVMTDLHRHAGEGAHVKIAYEIAPEFELTPFEGIEIEKPVYVITDEDVEARIRRIRFSQATQEPTDTVANEETVVTLNMHELQPEEGKEPSDSEGVQAYLADPDVLPEIRASLLGRKVGDKFEVQLPKNPSSAEASTKSEYGAVELTLTEAKSVTLPTMDEEFIKKVSRDKCSTEEELRKDIRDELEKGAIQRADEEYEENIVKHLLSLHDIPVPRTITHAVLEQMISDYKERNRMRGYPEEFGLDEEAFRERMWPIAESRGKWSLLQEKLIDVNKLAPVPEDFEELATKQAEEYGLSKENLMKYYEKDERVKQKLEAEKLGKWLRDQVEPVEKEIRRKD
jgi:trigger factor